MFRLFRSFGVVAIALTFAVVPSQSYAETGAISVKISKVGFIVGVGGGSGVLTFQGKQYPLSIGGVSLGTIGIAEMELVGTATNLNSAADVAGTYTALSASVAVAGGAKTATLKNSKGVVLNLKGREVGFEASLSLSGLTISLK
jgi:hypothetical protein